MGVIALIEMLDPDEFSVWRPVIKSLDVNLSSSSNV